MKSAFQKITRVGSLTGGTKWYLSNDCLLAAKRTMYVVEYRRFYLRDLESIVVWPRRSWLLRVIIPAALLTAIGVLLAVVGVFYLQWVNATTTGAIFAGLGLAWVGLELALGPTAESRIVTTGTTVPLALVKRTRRASKVLAKIDAAVFASRGATMQPAVPTPIPEPAGVSVRTNPETAAAVPSIGDATQTNGI